MKNICCVIILGIGLFNNSAQGMTEYRTEAAKKLIAEITNKIPKTYNYKDYLVFLYKLKEITIDTKKFALFNELLSNDQSFKNQIAAVVNHEVYDEKNNKTTLLIEAIRNRKESFENEQWWPVKLLLKLGADPNQSTSLLLPAEVRIYKQYGSLGFLKDDYYVDIKNKPMVIFIFQLLFSLFDRITSPENITVDKALIDIYLDILALFLSYGADLNDKGFFVREPDFTLFDLLTALVSYHRFSILTEPEKIKLLTIMMSYADEKQKAILRERWGALLAKGSMPQFAERSRSTADNRLIIEISNKLNQIPNINNYNAYKEFFEHLEALEKSKKDTRKGALLTQLFLFDPEFKKMITNVANRSTYNKGENLTLLTAAAKEQDWHFLTQLLKLGADIHRIFDALLIQIQEFYVKDLEKAKNLIEILNPYLDSEEKAKIQNMIDLEPIIRMIPKTKKYNDYKQFFAKLSTIKESKKQNAALQELIANTANSLVEIQDPHEYFDDKAQLMKHTNIEMLPLLTAAIEKQDWPFVKQLLQLGADVNYNSDESHLLGVFRKKEYDNIIKSKLHTSSAYNKPIVSLLLQMLYALDTKSEIDRNVYFNVIQLLLKHKLSLNDYYFYMPSPSTTIFQSFLVLIKELYTKEKYKEAEELIDMLNPYLNLEQKAQIQEYINSLGGMKKANFETALITIKKYYEQGRTEAAEKYIQELWPSLNAEQRGKVGVMMMEHSK